MIDWDRVIDLRNEVGTEEFNEVLDLFMAEVEETITRMRSAPDPAGFEEDLHFLKGSALNLGFVDFSKLCENGESRSVSITAVLASYDVSKQSFMEGLPKILT